MPGRCPDRLRPPSRRAHWPRREPLATPRSIAAWPPRRQQKRVPLSTTETFRDYGIRPATADALEAAGIVHPFTIQSLAIPIALAGEDVIGQARTGTGKTLGFGVPLLERLRLPGPTYPQALVVVPTRELCLQVTSDLTLAGAPAGARVLAIYGGRSYEPQVDALRAGVDVVVGTPGRLLDLVQQGHLELSEVGAVVLDEADKMLDLGFLPDIERLLALTPTTRQTLLFSATMPAEVVTLARRYMRRPVNIRAEDPSELATVPTTDQHVFRAHALDKVEMLARVLQAEGRGLSMVFCRTKRAVASVAENLETRGFAVAAVHGDLGQGAREQALRAFRSGKIDVLVATDVAARGIDVEGVTHVVNYECPDDEKTYLHRIGRTGRAGASGIAVTLVDWDDMPRWSLINDALGLPFPAPVETYSTSDHLYEELDIPRTARGLLPRAERTRLGLGAEQLEDLGETGRVRSRRPAERRERVRSAARVRRRTRSGQPIGDLPQVADSATTSDPSGLDEPTRRRRRRGGRGRRRGPGSDTSMPAAETA
jgi:superfamily II DNA/RNA helicase